MVKHTFFFEHKKVEVKWSTISSNFVSVEKRIGSLYFRTLFLLVIRIVVSINHLMMRHHFLYSYVQKKNIKQMISLDKDEV